MCCLSRRGCRTAGRVAYQIPSMIPYCVDVTVILPKSVTMGTQMPYIYIYTYIYTLHCFDETSVMRIDVVYVYHAFVANRLFGVQMGIFISEND